MEGNAEAATHPALNALNEFSALKAAANGQLVFNHPFNVANGIEVFARHAFYQA